MDFLTGGKPIELSHKVDTKSAVYLGLTLFLAVFLGVLVGTVLMKR